MPDRITITITLDNDEMFILPDAVKHFSPKLIIEAAEMGLFDEKGSSEYIRHRVRKTQRLASRLREKIIEAQDAARLQKGTNKNE